MRICRHGYSIHVDIFLVVSLAPVLGPRMILKGELINQGRSTSLVSVTFFDQEGNKLVYALVTLKVVRRSGEEG